MFLEPVEPFQVADVVNKLKPMMSCGPDEIPTIIIKESINSILIPITHIINRLLLTGPFPLEMKTAKVIPNIKASSPSLLQNYPPGSMLPTFSKVIEYGYLPKHRTIHPFLYLNVQKQIYFAIRK